MKYDENGRLVEFGEFPVLETPRLILREMTLDDAEFYIRNFSDPTVVDMEAFDPPATLEDARKELLMYCINPFKENRGIRWGMELKSEKKLIGTLGFHNWVKGNGFGYRAEMGYDLLREYRNQGYMTEAMIAALDFGFSTMRLNRVVIHIDTRNEPSQALVRRLGFTYEGTLRQNTFHRGRFLDDMVFSLLAEEWRRREPTPGRPILDI